MEQLALFGGPKKIKSALKRYNSIGVEEVNAAKLVIESGVLSKYIGGWDPDFFGGDKVQEFERSCEDYFHVKHAIAVNSWTSGLIAILGAIGLEPGDEVIVPPWTMCASATSILHWNAIPVFADIEPETFCIDPESVIKCISPYTKAIMAVDIFGHSANMEKLLEISDKYNLKIISDTAQSPGALIGDKYAGTWAHVGGFSLNYHKHIHTGEGGIVVTNDSEIAERVQLIRNHAEAVVSGKGVSNIKNMVGYNFRLGEIESAIGIEQLKKLKKFVSSRQNAAHRLTDGIKNLKGLRIPIVEEGYSHAYYMYPMILDLNLLGVTRDLIVRALRADGIDGLSEGYANVHLLPIFQKKIAFGSNGFPWTSDICKRDVSYSRGICPVAEELHNSTFIGFEMCLHDLGDGEVDLIIAAFRKVWDNLEVLKGKHK